jgi:TetR/AcrR family transcriptional regulator
MNDFEGITLFNSTLFPSIFSPSTPAMSPKDLSLKNTEEAGDQGELKEGTQEFKTRLKPGERRIQILQALAMMLERPGAERVTTAALAAQIGVSEAALYRHFASKAQMFEGLIDFIEESIYGLLNRIAESDVDPSVKAQKMIFVLLQFADKNPGMTRVMIGDALVLEHDRLIQRMNHFFDRIESMLRQVLKESYQVKSSSTPTVLNNQLAGLLLTFVMGRLHRFVRGDFKKLPTEQLEMNLTVMLSSNSLYKSTSTDPTSP